MNAKAAAIEFFLLRRADWVSAQEICRAFQVDERELRATKEIPGLCSAFAISGNRGFRHIETCTADEWTAFEARIRSHGISELVRVKNLRTRRNAVQTQLEMQL